MYKIIFKSGFRWRAVLTKNRDARYNRDIRLHAIRFSKSKLKYKGFELAEKKFSETKLVVKVRKREKPANRGGCVCSYKASVHVRKIYNAEQNFMIPRSFMSMLKKQIVRGFGYLADQLKRQFRDSFDRNSNEAEEVSESNKGLDTMSPVTVTVANSNVLLQDVVLSFGLPLFRIEGKDTILNNVFPAVVVYSVLLHIISALFLGLILTQKDHEGLRCGNGNNGYSYHHGNKCEVAIIIFIGAFGCLRTLSVLVWLSLCCM